LVCLDEIQRKPEIFPLLRSLVGDSRRPGMYLILGSASREMLKQSSESLAARISFKRLSPFLWSEVPTDVKMETYLARGGFPPSLFAVDDKASFEWRLDFISTFLERDLLQFTGFTILTMRKLWQMLAHVNGQTINFNKLAGSLGASNTTIRNYIDLLEGTFMLVQLQPYSGNTKKRLIKSPKVYLSDSGIVSALLNLNNVEALMGHPVFGSLWEGMVLTNLQAQFPRLDYSFYRTGHGAEVDIIVTSGRILIVIECKASMTPKIQPGTWNAISDLQPDATFVVAPVAKGYPMREGVTVITAGELIDRVAQLMDYR